MTLRILWLAFNISLVLFMVVLLVLRSSGDGTPAHPAEPILLPVFAMMAFFMVLASVLLPALMLPAQLKGRKVEVVEVADPDAVGMYRDVAPMRRVFAKPHEVRQRTASVFQTTWILGIALNESVAIFGLVLGLLGFELSVVAPFFAVAMVSCLLRFPRLSAIDRVAEKAFAASFPT